MDIIFEWGEKKNRQLIEGRGISFESVVASIEQGGLVDVLEHPNQELYAGQLIYVVEILDYIYLVPVVKETGGTHFLKPIMPSLKATRDYGKRRLR